MLVVSSSEDCAHGFMEENFAFSLIFLLFIFVRTKLVQQKIYGMSFVGVTYHFLLKLTCSKLTSAEKETVCVHLGCPGIAQFTLSLPFEEESKIQQPLHPEQISLHKPQRK